MFSYVRLIFSDPQIYSDVLGKKCLCDSFLLFCLSALGACYWFAIKLFIRLKALGFVFTGHFYEA